MTTDRTPEPTPTPEQVDAELTAVALVEAVINHDQDRMAELTAGFTTEAAQLAVSVAALAASIAGVAEQESGLSVASLLQGARRAVIEREASAGGGQE